MSPYLFRLRFASAVVGALLVSAAARAQTAVVTTDVPVAPASPAVGKDGPLLKRLTFDGAVQHALDHNPTALQADAELRRFRALMEEVRAASLPTLSGVVAYTRLDANRMAGPQLLEPINGINLSAVLSVPVIGVRGWVQWQQANDQVDVARMNAADVRRTVAVTTAHAYLIVITQKRLLETAITARDSARAHYDFTRAQLLGGVGNRLDEARAAQELTADEVLVQDQEVALFHAREALGVLVASEGAVDVTEWTLVRPPTLSEALGEAQTRRADVRAREAAARAADRTVRQNYADYLPYLNLVAFPFYQDPPVPTIPQTGWQAELVLTIPLYDGGFRYGQEHERKAIDDEMHLNVEATLRQARSEVRASFEELQRSDMALDQARQSAAFAAKALGLANLAYRGGATTNLEVIDAERRSRDADTQEAIAEDASRQARLDLLASSGRFPQSQ
jgi:outer membrane protein TolC